MLRLWRWKKKVVISYAGCCHLWSLRFKFYRCFDRSWFGELWFCSSLVTFPWLTRNVMKKTASHFSNVVNKQVISSLCDLSVNSSLGLAQLARHLPIIIFALSTFLSDGAFLALACLDNCIYIFAVQDNGMVYRKHLEGALKVTTAIPKWFSSGRRGGINHSSAASWLEEGRALISVLSSPGPHHKCDGHRLGDWRDLLSQSIRGWQRVALWVYFRQ